MDQTLSMLPDFRRPSPEMLAHIHGVDEGGEQGGAGRSNARH
ncbi:MAG TPA: hypothetical protein VM890_09635 [Longimicrobium sp.]|jgi:hypothetical protein|nr:hypothetical protein [Longimicrobium sp.]